MDGTRIVLENTGPDVEVTGTAPGATAGDELALWCVRGHSGDQAFAGDVVVNGGEFSRMVPRNTLRVGRCRIRALPEATNPYAADLSPFTGPVVTIDARQTFTTNPAHASGNVPYDYFLNQQQGRGFGGYDSIASCGLCGSRLVFADTALSSEWIFYANGFLDDKEAPALDRAGARVDGHNAWGSAVASEDSDPGPGYTAASQALAGVPPLSYTVTGGEAGQDVVIDEAQDLVRCRDGDPIPLQEPGCGAFVSTMVRVERRVVQSEDGTRFDFATTFRSLDGQPHALDLHWTEYFNTPLPPHEPGYRFAWTEGDYATRATGDTVPGTTGPAPIFLRTDQAAPDGDRLWAQGLVMYDGPVGEIRFTGEEKFVVPVALTVPAEGTVSMRTLYKASTTRAELEELAGSTRNAWVAPTIEITSPAEGATVAAAGVDVTGTARDDTALTSFTVNGRPVVVAADGTWSTRETLAIGENRVVAVARDSAGNETTVARTFAFVPPPPLPPGDSLAPTLTGVALSATRFRVAAGPTAVAAATRRGTVVRYALSEAARVTFAISRARPGRRAGGKCRRPTRANRRRARCTRFVKAGRTITRSSPAGASRLRFSGRIARKALRRGRHRMAIRAADAAGNRSRARTLTFRIVRR